MCGRHLVANYATNASGARLCLIDFSYKNYLSYRLYTLGLLCLWQCLIGMFYIFNLHTLMFLIDSIKFN